MTLIVIDYSSSTTLPTPLPPQQSSGKFVVMQQVIGQHEGERFALFAPFAMAEYHANIVEQFAVEQQLNGRYNNKRDEFYLQSDDWQIEGGGLWQYQAEQNWLRIYGQSMAYGRIEDLNELATALRVAGAFNQAKILVG